ncbi:DUF4810 domain-containing protein [Pseudoteredinibacter isoporae]|uniref:DUF4810 domain-containing protein n=1 Tax=Pseudoteredinibacter isoporae TaxID=570281 RepID=A0A7X0JQD0_9GAMM|nr:DUF4810 domain-containing protein [Pseudoteredinibacter isoporae]MBB6520363.1 hypothetical protein [Pseudoteredinibacter isoporae]NHO85933.1 DUF4810 domain-containing protein [Pseudoteredinibacter isoporae]NIB25615.1 DUF4810 domain-containing protein [Pseudoteredinibacter isoporae]
MDKFYKGLVSLLFVSSLLLGACASQPKASFYWGSYQKGLYDSYKNPGADNVGEQIEAIQASIEHAKSKDLKLAPGLYAHLAYLHLQQGNPDLARQYFKVEAQEFPEAKVFMDRLISNLDNHGSKPSQDDRDA